MNNIKSERQRLGFSRKELAERIGRSESVVGKWERGKTSPTLRDTICMAGLFNCSIDYLAGITDERLPYSKYHVISLVNE